MIVEILGSGCPKCEKVYQRVEKALSELGIEGHIQKITDMNTITARGVMLTPAVFVKGVKVVEGRVPETSELKSWIDEEIDK